MALVSDLFGLGRRQFIDGLLAGGVAVSRAT
jgi:hypothetical protein